MKNRMESNNYPEYKVEGRDINLKIKDVIRFKKFFYSFEEYVITEVINDGEEFKIKDINSNTEAIFSDKNEIEKIGTYVKVHDRFKCKCCGYVEDKPSKYMVRLNNGTFRINCDGGNFSKPHIANDHYGIMEYVGIILDE